MLKANLKEKFELFDEYWTPKIIGELNDQFVKIAKLKGEFIWHDHEQEDELFYIVKGSLLLKFRDRNDVLLKEGELFIVPAGVDHLPIAEEECWVMLMEPKSTQHTGSAQTENTVSIEDQEWI
ncbi:cupin domain-containing protein [Gracilimonas tropica]|uniref:cupin domain-containing protein n=1 Tax=Gracilimonas tropica TaxID=454600 RepID=UPI00036113CF|nr:cupin domain-containing protein [Gracilimonas tropica]